MGYILGSPYFGKLPFRILGLGVSGLGFMHVVSRTVSKHALGDKTTDKNSELQIRCTYRFCLWNHLDSAKTCCGLGYSSWLSRGVLGAAYQVLRNSLYDRPHIFLEFLFKMYCVGQLRPKLQRRNFTRHTQKSQGWHLLDFPRTVAVLKQRTDHMGKRHKLARECYKCSISSGVVFHGPTTL